MSAGALALVGALPPSWVGRVLDVVLLSLVGITASAVALCRMPTRQVVVLSIYGVLLALLFFALQAPDVALSEVTIGAVVLPLLLLLALAKLRQQERSAKSRDQT